VSTPSAGLSRTGTCGHSPLAVPWLSLRTERTPSAAVSCRRGGGTRRQYR
jgi:hypothetical protein